MTSGGRVESPKRVPEAVGFDIGAPQQRITGSPARFPPRGRRDTPRAFVSGRFVWRKNLGGSSFSAGDAGKMRAL